ncbi:hypothetical protein [Streptomyces alanosinicus]|uniref:Secreted protein n=1 Tax=Streptomyces alanosinicus TaxID=68171 RepID=A0A918YKG2_9ACTN|nr:hypothetical protein [Streptomyces alanosinicus]GHE06516.1 hypothetical protein GCM10010339_47270 [Streptomyces alanosinicus]
MISTVHRHTVRAAVVAAVGLSALGLGATAASAKISYDFAASPHTVKAGARVHVKGDAANDEDRFQRFCIQQRPGKGPWHTVKCARGGIGLGGSADVWVTARQRGTLQFRGALYEKDLHGKHDLVLRWVTPTVNVKVR